MFATPWLMLLLACTGTHSDRDDTDVARVVGWVAACGVLVWVVAVAFGVGRPPEWRLGAGEIGLPTVFLTLLLVGTVAGLPRLLDGGPPPVLAVTVTGERGWWRVRYRTPRGTVELANELRLPIGLRTPLVLETADGGTRDTLSAMLLEDQRFADWLANEAAIARRPVDALTARGATVFRTAGCGACHTVRGTTAAGSGPDLTHIGARTTVALSRANDRRGFREWLLASGHVACAEPDLDALVAYLDLLE